MMCIKTRTVVFSAHAATRRFEFCDNLLCIQSVSGVVCCYPLQLPLFEVFVFPKSASHVFPKIRFASLGILTWHQLVSLILIAASGVEPLTKAYETPRSTTPNRSKCVRDADRIRPKQSMR